jgi:hypothetical protein
VNTIMTLCGVVSAALLAGLAAAYLVAGVAPHREAVVITSASALVEQRFNDDRVVRAAARKNTPLSPCCGEPVQGTAVRWCGQCGHTIQAADLNREVTR